jgi:hypothetical protein
VACNVSLAGAIEMAAKRRKAYLQGQTGLQRSYSGWFTLAFQESRSAAYGLFPDQLQLEFILRTLNLAGFENEDLCVLIAAEHPIVERLRDWDYRLQQDLFPDVSPDCLIAWLSSYGAVVIPEIGFFVGSSQYMKALALPEELLRNSEKGVLVGLGLSPSEAARYENRMHDKMSFVFVSCNDVPQSEWARELLSAMGAEEASLSRVENQNQVPPQGTGILTY